MLKGKTILVAGAGGLLGHRLVEVLLRQGASVIATDINLTQLEERAPELPPKLINVRLDLNNAQEVKSFFAGLSGIDGAINCAYPRNPRYGAKMFDVELDDFNENVALHLGSSFLFIQQCAAYFQRDSKPFSLVNISSIYGVVAPRFDIYDGCPMTMPVEYAAIKSALIHLSKYVASYVSNSLFRSNCVSPGGIYDGQPDKFVAAYREHCLGQGMLDMDDIMGSIIFLLSDASRFVNGQNIVVDDGFSL